MSDSTATPAHRTGSASRSGDTHLINDAGELVNLDEQAREESGRRPAAEGGDGTNVAASGEAMPPVAASNAKSRKPAE